MYGQNAVIGIAFQNSWGTAAAVGSLHHIPILNEDLGLAADELISQNLNTRLDENDAYSGMRRFDGTVEMEAQPKALGAILKAAVNDPTSTLSGSVGTHTFNPRTGDWDVFAPNRPFSYYKYLAEGGSAQLFYDLVGTRLEFQLSAGGFLIARMGAIAGKTSAVASQALSLDSTKRWPWNHASLSLGGAANIDISEFTLTHDEGIEGRWVLDGSLYANRGRRTTARTVRVAGTLIFRDMTEYNNFAAENVQPLVITLRGTEAIQSGYFNTLKIDMPSFKWLELKPRIQGPGEVSVPFTGKAQYNTGSGRAVQYTLTNTWAAY